MSNISRLKGFSADAIEALEAFRSACKRDMVFMLSDVSVDKTLVKWPGDLDGLDEVPSYDMLSLLTSKAGVGLSTESLAILLYEYVSGDSNLSFRHDRFLIVYMQDEVPNVMLVESWGDSYAFYSFQRFEDTWTGDPLVLRYNLSDESWLGNEIGPEIFDDETLNEIFLKWTWRAILLIYSINSRFSLEAEIDDLGGLREYEKAVRKQRALAEIPATRQITIDRVRLEHLYNEKLKYE